MGEGLVTRLRGVSGSGTTCLDGLDDYCARSFGATALNVGFAGLGAGLANSVEKCGYTAAEATGFGSVLFGQKGLVSGLIDATERPGTAEKLQQ